MENKKNPIAYLKHIVKDPIRTIAEADARKKEIMPLLYISIAVTLLFTILEALLETGFLTIFGLVGLAGVGLSAFLLFVISKAKSRFAALTCDDCGTMLEISTPEEFAKYVTYSILKEDVKFNLTHPSSNDGVVAYVRATGDATAVLEVSFVCPNCGKTKTFKYTIDPFKCKLEEKKVSVLNIELVKMRLENAVRAVLALYESGDRKKIPYSIQSIHHPNYENREKPQVRQEEYNGVTITYHREIDELVEGLFIRNELNGNITVNK